MKWEGVKRRIDSEEDTRVQSRKEEIKENETKVKKELKRIREKMGKEDQICKIEFP